MSASDLGGDLPSCSLWEVVDVQLFLIALKRLCRSFRLLHFIWRWSVAQLGIDLFCLLFCYCLGLVRSQQKGQIWFHTATNEWMNKWANMRLPKNHQFGQSRKFPHLFIILLPDTNSPRFTWRSLDLLFCTTCFVQSTLKDLVVSC